jgi:hypothetical protein
MSTVSGVGSVAPVYTENLSVDDALILVQMERVKLTESELGDQINAIRARNDRIKSLNDIRAQLQTVKAGFNGNANDTDNASGQQNWNQDDKTLQKAAAKLADMLDAMGIAPDTPNINELRSGNFSKSRLDALDGDLKGKIDSETSGSQMDMVRMQSLNNKRSEAFDTMTNMLKKSSDSKSSVVSNMR